MNIFRLAAVQVAGFRGRTLLNRTEPVVNNSCLIAGQNARGNQGLCLRAAALNVRRQQTAIESKRRVEAREVRIRLAAESSAPEFHPLHVSSTNGLHAGARKTPGMKNRLANSLSESLSLVCPLAGYYGRQPRTTTGQSSMHKQSEF